jgi:hypothetical protein
LYAAGRSAPGRRLQHLLHGHQHRRDGQSALLAAPLRNLWSFNMAFAAAGVGMLIGVVVLLVELEAPGIRRTGPTRAAVRTTSASSRCS